MTLFTSHLQPKLPPLFLPQFTCNSRTEAMANDHHHLQKPFSLLQTNDLFVNKILSRNSSFGRSARLSACRLPGQIPFKWEAQPGKPKDQNSEKLPSIGLPPQVASGENLSEASNKVSKQQTQPVRVWFWKKPKRKLRNVAKKNGSSSSRRCNDERELSRKSNEESSSSCISYTSSSSSSSNGYGRRHSKLGSLAKGFIRWAF